MNPQDAQSTNITDARSQAGSGASAPCFKAVGIGAVRARRGGPATVCIQVDLKHRFNFRITSKQADYVAEQLSRRRRHCVNQKGSSQPGSVAPVPVAEPRTPVNFP